MLSEIATRQKKSLTFLSDVLERIQTRFRHQPLLTKGSGSGGKSELSNLGRKVLHGVFDQFRELEIKSERLQIAASFSLVSNELISPAIREFVSSLNNHEVRLGLKLMSSLEFGSLIQELHDGKLDIAIVWGEPDRLKEVGGIRIEKMDDTPFDLVVISNDENLITRVDKALADNSVQMSGVRFPIAKMERLLREVMHGRKHVKLSVSQPLAGAFCFHSEQSDDSSIQTDSFDASIALLKAKVCEVTIAPAFYSNLEQAQSRGELFFSKPVGQLSVAIFYALERPPSQSARRLIGFIKDQLSVATRRIRELVEWTSLPELSQLKVLRYGYYIDGSREPVIGNILDTTMCRPPFCWKWETFEWKTGTGKKLEQIFAYCRNVDGDNFIYSASKSSSAIIIEANAPGDAPANRKSGQKFVSFFTQALEKPLRLVGVWTTTEPRSSGVYATVLSEKRLRLEDLEQIQHTSYRSVLTADHGLRFENQP